MYVRKIRNENRVGTITLTPSEVELALRMGISVEKYVKNRLVQIAKERRWKWFFKEYK